MDLPGFGHSERRDDLLSPRAMGEFAIRLVDALGLEKPHAVGPDIGTSALLFAAAAEPGRLRSLVIGSGASYPLQLGDIVKELVEAPDIEPYRNADPREIIVESMRYVRSYPTELPALAQLLPGIQTPVQIINGAHDPAVPAVNAEYLHERLPHSKLDLLDVGHFAWEDTADEYAALITSWWSDGYASVGAAREGTSA